MTRSRNEFWGYALSKHLIAEGKNEDSAAEHFLAGLKEQD